MKYVAFLRGINVGGNALVKMTELKTAFEKAGFTNVLTYINSGNVIFESTGEDKNKLTKQIEEILEKSFFAIKSVVLSQDDIEEIVKDVPADWNRGKDLRCYIAFLKETTQPQDVLKEMHLNKTVDTAEIGKSVVYMTTKLSGLTKSGFTKLIGKKIYKEMTMRNYTTVQKLFALAKGN